MTSRGSSSGVTGCAAVALVPVAVLHVVGSSSVDPLAQTVSDYVAVPGGFAMLAVSALALAAAGGLLAAQALRARVSTAVPIAALLASWLLALLTVAAFPTNVGGAPADLAAVVHRYAGAWVLTVPPLVGLLVARGSAAAGRPAPLLRALVVATAVVDAGFLLSHVPIVVLGSSGFPLLGLVERVLYGLVILLLPVMSLALRHVPCDTGGEVVDGALVGSAVVGGAVVGSAVVGGGVAAGPATAPAPAGTPVAAGAGAR